MAKFNILYLDPPWKYRDKRASGKTACGAENHYECMSDERIINMPVESLAADNAVCYLWIPPPLLFDQKDAKKSLPGQCLAKWGFNYRTFGFVWIKLNKGNKKPWFGVGAYSKSNVEVCLMGVRGSVGRLQKDKKTGLAIPTNPDEKLRVQSNSVSQLIFHSRMRHSEKPPVTRTKIEKIWGALPRIELFARRVVPGWESIGYDIDGKDIYESIKDVSEI